MSLIEEALSLTTPKAFANSKPRAKPWVNGRVDEQP